MTLFAPIISLGAGRPPLQEVLQCSLFLYSHYFPTKTHICKNLTFDYTYIFSYYYLFNILSESVVMCNGTAEILAAQLILHPWLQDYIKSEEPARSQ